jgi:hypothetical protein
LPRAKPFSRADVESRKVLYKAFSLDPAVIEKIKAILKFEGVAAANVERLVSEIGQAIRTYKATGHANRQESPARIVAALKPGLPLAKGLRVWLSTLPPWLRFDLKIPELEELFDRIKKLSDDWQRKARAGPVGHGYAALSLRDSLRSILANDIKNEPERRRAVANILRAEGIRFPDEKKNRRKFTGVGRPK